MLIQLPIGDVELGIGVFLIWDWRFKSPIPNLTKHQSPIQNNQFVILSSFGEFHFKLSNTFFQRNQMD